MGPMPEPVDLTEKFGELWCVTVAPLPLELTLELMGVDTPDGVPTGLADLTHRLVSGVSDGHVLLLARPVDPEWTLVLEGDATAGWTGQDPDVLAELSVDQTACSIMCDPNKIHALFAEHGGSPCGLDVVTGRRWGTPSIRLADALTAAGFPDDDDDEHADHLVRWTFSQCAALALHAATGVHLTDDMFADPWIGGLAPVS